ncbi:MAG: DUF4832 domain-containing protein [Polyangiaceae bacterium]|nr:DUF4832 domain-containing protein [Polyangiaceae bacterium]
MRRVSILVALLALACSEESGQGSGSGGAPTGGSGGSGGSGAAGGSGATGGGGGSGNSTSVTPKEISDLLANPGMGWQTFHTYADQDPNLAGLPSGSAYFRFTWQTLEPTDGTIKASIVSDTLKKARAAGQSFMFRVMTAGDDASYAPTWLEAAGCKVFKFSTGGATLTAPDLDDATCWARFEALMSAVGKAVGTEPDVEVDLGGVGLWGEGHFSGTTPEVPLPSLATRKKVIDLHLKLFPNSPSMGLIGDVETLTYSVTKGAGWRADCFGDYGMFSATWNHMDDMYQQHVQQAGAQSAWQAAPVAWESCGTMQDWVDKGFDVPKIFQYGLDLHGSFINNKSAKIPAGAQHRSQIEAVLRKLGYRLVLRSLTHDATASAGGTLKVASTWDNVGVAPPYPLFELQLRLSPATGGSPVVLKSSADVRAFLPGSHQVTDSFALPPTVTPGEWTLAVGVTGTPGVPMLRLAIDGRDAEGWYPVSELLVK